MLKKDVLMYLHKDWTSNLKRLQDEQSTPDGSTPAAMERIRTADKWVAHYAGQLRELYGVKA